jgi:hypothetical protein
MSNAKKEVAARGWEVYKAADPRPSLVAINEVLLGEGLGQVAPRMHTHYRRMERYGHLGEYITINDFDIHHRGETA